VPLDGAVHRRLQGVQVGHVDVVDVDAVLGQQRRQLAQHLLGHPRLVLDLRHARCWFRVAASHVRHRPILVGWSVRSPLRRRPA
jgi:hypothetical protein